MQLPPVSEVRNHDLHNISKTFLWSQSSIFFESIFIGENEKILLDEYLNKITPSYNISKQSNLNFTHRFGNNLAQVLDKFVYKFGFQSASENSTQIISINAQSNPLEVYERSNQWEVDLIKELISLPLIALSTTPASLSGSSPINSAVSILLRTKVS